MYNMPAEWEPHAGVWVAWPHNKEHWPTNFDVIPIVFAEMFGALAVSEKVYVCVSDEGAKTEVKLFLEKAGMMGQNIELVLIPNNSSWLRDIGPIFVRDEHNKLHASLWKFNAWGNKYQPYDLDAVANRKIAEFLKIPTVDAGIVLEGGSVDPNGKGTLLTTEQCLLNKNRNPELSREQIEQKLHDILGATNVVWLGEGIEGDDTDGHIDDLARFVNPTTVVTVVEDKKIEVNYPILQENLKKLEKARDQDGKQLTIVTLPMPKRIWSEYDNMPMPASYANFYIGNTVVLVPTFQCDKDEVALRTLQSVFPDRKVVGLNASDFIFGQGTVHCTTQQVPRSNV